MNPHSGAANDEDNGENPTAYDTAADESFFTAADGLSQEQEESESAEDVASEVARAGAHEGDSVGSCPASDVEAVTTSEGGLSGQGTADEATLPSNNLEGSSEDVETASSSVDHGPSAQASPRSTLIHSRPGPSLSVQSRQSPRAQPFEKRFHARKTSGALGGVRNASPGFLDSHSRQASYSSQQLSVAYSETNQDEERKPWEVIKWTKLKKLSSQVFSEAGRRAFGNQSYLVVGASIVIGTSKGLIMVFDYQQNLKSIIGQGTPASECGAITALALSADHSNIAAGHSNGFIFTWDTSSSARPFLTIPPLPREHLASRTGDGHVAEHAVLHVGFLGTRHTALVSADQSGMAFSHLATRGFGAVARTVVSTRILGRYSLPSVATGLVQKPTTVLACAPLPFGNVEQPTDELGLTALLTPYLLVVVSTTPTAQTHFKTSRPKAIDLHSPLTGCIAWFPAVSLKPTTGTADNAVSTTKLVYCWSNFLQIIDLKAERHNAEEDPKRPHVVFQRQRQWRSEEAIVSVQWISRSVLAILTITQRLLIFDDLKLEISDSADLNARHIFHKDLFSQQLESLNGSKATEMENAMYGAVADAYSMSFKAYRGRLFLLNASDVTMGTLSNWADRLIALMEVGRLIQAIQLAKSYYDGTTDKTTVGLPEDDASRKATVGTRIVQIIRASLDYTFKQDENDELGTDITTALQDLVEPIFSACMPILDSEFLLHEVYESYSNASCQDIFLYALEPRILDEEIRSVPADLLKDLVNWYSSLSLTVRLEAILCALDTTALDLDQVTGLCKANNLYDALIYVWNQAIGDFVTPLDDLLALIRDQDPMTEYVDEQSPEHMSALKVFPYLAYSLTGRVYPSGADMPVESADEGKAQLYHCLFVGDHENPGTRPAATQPSSYPRLRALLSFDSFEFMSMLNEAFEDSFLNDTIDPLTSNGAPISIRPYNTLSINREHIIKVLMEVSSSSTSEHEDRIHLDIFIARNMPKFPQYIRLPGVALRRILEELCDPPRDDLMEECQLSVEYLLSIYRPPDLENLVPLFEQAGFFRILKFVHRNSRQYPKWLQTHFDDLQEPDAVLDCISDCLNTETELSPRQLRETRQMIVHHAEDLAARDSDHIAVILKQLAPDLLQDFFSKLSDCPLSQYNFLKSFFAPKGQADDDSTAINMFLMDNTERYVQLMCKYDLGRVAPFVNTSRAGDLRLDHVLPIMESTGVVDAAVVLLARDGMAQEAMSRLLKHLKTLQSALIGLLQISSNHIDSTVQHDESVTEVLDAVNKYVKMGIWLCQAPSPGAEYQPKTQRQLEMTDMTEDKLTPTEMRWLDLIDATAKISNKVTTELPRSPVTKVASPKEADAALSKTAQAADEVVRKVIQDCFTALLAASSGKISASSSTSAAPSTPTLSLAVTPQPNAPASAPSQPPRLLPILNAFLTRLTSTTLSLTSSPSNASETLLPILSSIFSAHEFEHSMLHLATGLLDKDVFVSVADADARRRRGWRPNGRACAGCGLRAWGVGGGVEMWEDWAERREKEGRKRKLRQLEPSRSGSRVEGREARNATSKTRDENGVKDKGKGRLVEPTNVATADENKDETKQDHERWLRGLVVFACGHLFHRGCLEVGMKSQGRPVDGATEIKQEDQNAASEIATPSYACLICH